jgi:hypothetical protein
MALAAVGSRSRLDLRLYPLLSHRLLLLVPFECLESRSQKLVATAFADAPPRRR